MEEIVIDQEFVRDYEEREAYGVAGGEPRGLGGDEDGEIVMERELEEYARGRGENGGVARLRLNSEDEVTMESDGAFGMDGEDLEGGFEFGIDDQDDFMDI